MARCARLTCLSCTSHEFLGAHAGIEQQFDDEFVARAVWRNETVSLVLQRAVWSQASIRASISSCVSGSMRGEDL